MDIRLAWPASLLALASLAACGGGGGGGGSSTFTPPVAAEPVWLVFTADKRIDERVELFATLSDRSIEPVNLSAAVEPVQVAAFSVSADGRWVAYTARADEDGSGVIDAADGPFDLYWTRVDGSAAPVRISGELPAHAGIRFFEWSPVANELVFSADIASDDVDELYIVTQALPSAVRINGDLGSSLEMGQAHWSPDGRYVAEIVRNRSNLPIMDRVAIDLYDTAAPAAGSTRITGPTLPGATAASGRNIEQTVIFAPDSSRLAYAVRDRDADTRIHYQAFPDGSFARVTAPLNPNETGAELMAWSADSRYLAYAIGTAAVGINKLDAYDTVAGFAHRVLTAPNGGAMPDRSDSFAWRPGSYELAVFASAAATGLIELYVLRGEAVNASLPPPASAPGPGESYLGGAWSADGRYFAYIERDDNDATLALASIEPDSGDLRRIVSHASTSTIDMPSFDWISGQRLLYSVADGIHVAAAGEPGSGSAIEGGLDIDIGTAGAPEIVAGANGRVVDPDEQTIAFIALRPGTDIRSLFHVRPDGSRRIDLAGSMIGQGDVDAFAFGAARNP